MDRQVLLFIALATFLFAFDGPALGDDTAPASSAAPQQAWNLHLQNTDIVQGDLPFPARYSGRNSLDPAGQVQHSESFDVYAGLRLWRGGEFHLDGELWNGFGLNNAVGIEDYPNGDAFKAGARIVDFSFTRLFIRQTIGLGGEQLNVPDGELTLASAYDRSRIVLTAGRFTPTDVFDTNAYANDPRRQFMNWAFVNNVSWDYPCDSLGYTTGVTAEWYQPAWTIRYGFFQSPGRDNSWTVENRYLTFPTPPNISGGEFFRSWGMAWEFEHRYTLIHRPGAIRFLVWLNQAGMGNYRAALSAPHLDIDLTRAHRYKYGFALNWEQEIADGVGLFSRLGWNDGKEQAWTYTDINYSGSLGIYLSGQSWRRPGDSLGLAGVCSGISHDNKEFLEAGGMGMLDGDGALSYGWEKALETYYNWQIIPNLNLTFDYQFVVDPAFNRDRGPVSIFAARLHWEI